MLPTTLDLLGIAEAQAQKTELQFLGHAGFRLTCNGVTLLCDPWLSESGAFLHTWHQFPPNDFLDRSALYEADYLYISHDHADHFDRDFLRAFPKHKVTVLLADFVSDTFARQVAALGFPRILTLPDWQPYSLGDDFSVTLIKDSSLYKTDSALLIQADGLTVLDKNDCYLSEACLDRLRDYDCDLLFAQYSGAMWYPAVYGYAPEKERQIAREIRKSLQDSFVETADRVGARYIVHSAGPPCFLEEKFFHLNVAENGIFPDQNDVFEELSQRLSGTLLTLLPGDELTLDAEGTPDICTLRRFDFARKAAFLADYRSRRAATIESYLNGLPQPGADFMFRFKRHIGKLFSASKSLRHKVNALVRFTITGENGGRLYVDTRDRRFSLMNISLGKVDYEIILAAPIANLLVEGEETWEDVFLSMRFEARRNPDLYNFPLFALLRYGHDAKMLGQVEKTLQEGDGEFITVREGSTQYRIQRYCPHAGEDLAHAVVHDGKLICPRHKWVFDLECGGQCLSGGNLPLQMMEVLGMEEMEGQV